MKVTCTPRAVQSYQASLQITVTDNQFEDTLVQLIGEGYREEVILDNLPSIGSSSSSTSALLMGQPDGEQLEASDLLADEDLTALKSNVISFGDCYINERKQLLFTMKNVSKSQCYRFEWQSSSSLSTAAGHDPTLAAVVQFSPRLGHLHAGCAKDITVTFRSSEPRFLRNELAQCLLTKISFQQPIDEVIRKQKIKHNSILPNSINYIFCQSYDRKIF